MQWGICRHFVVTLEMKAVVAAGVNVNEDSERRRPLQKKFASGKKEAAYSAVS
jgi:hypothetical protein